MRPVPVAVLLSALVLAGCAAQSAPAPSPSVEVVSAERTCKQVSNVLTVLFNASVSRAEERSSEQELEGSILLADSMLDEVEMEPQGEFEQSIEALRAMDTVEFALPMISNGSTGWHDALEEINEVCRGAGTELAVEAWTGG